MLGKRFPSFCGHENMSQGQGSCKAKVQRNILDLQLRLFACCICFLLHLFVCLFREVCVSSVRGILVVLKQFLFLF